MKLKNIFQYSAAITIAAGFASTACAGDEKEGKITMDKVPPTVQQAVKAYASESEIKGIGDSAVGGTQGRPSG